MQMPATLPTRRQARLRCTIAAVLTTSWVALGTFSVVAPGPAVIMILLAMIVVTPTALAACSLPVAMLVLRVHRDPRQRRRPLRRPLTPRGRRALAALRRDLDALPDAPHPVER
jgi:hypothetical protein